MTTLRDATEGDLPAIVGIYNATIPGRMVTADLEPVSVASRLSWMRDRDSRRRPVWVLEEDGRIAAWLSFDAFSQRRGYDPTALVGLYVADDSKRRGLGRRLLGEAIARAPDLGLRTLIGYIWAHNEPSLRLFGAMGFANWGLLPRVADLGSLECDLVIVGLRVPSPEVKDPHPS